jgi:hypothetical protein
MSSIRSFALLGLALAMVSPSIAAPKPTPAPPLIQIQLEYAQLRKLQLSRSRLPQATVEPGGLEVTQAVDPDWLTLGLEVGDLIIAENGRPIGERLQLTEGTYVFEVLRNRKLVLLRIVVHPNQQRTRTIDEDRYDRLLEMAAGSASDPHSTPVRGTNGQPSGVRVIDMLLGLYLECEVGDLIRTIDGHPIRTDAELSAAIQNLRIGTTDLTMERAGRPIQVTLIRKAPLDLMGIKQLTPTRFEVTQAFASAISADHGLLTRKLSASPRIVNGRPSGFAVYDVHASSPAAKLGILDGDIVLDFDGHPIDTFENVIDAAQALEHATSLAVHILRKGKPVTLSYVIR